MLADYNKFCLYKSEKNSLALIKYLNICMNKPSIFLITITYF